MTDRYAQKIGIPEGHTLVMRETKWLGARHGQDTDEYKYDELNESGEVVASYHIEDSTSVYPPFGSTITVTKL